LKPHAAKLILELPKKNSQPLKVLLVILRHSNATATLKQN